MSKSEATEFQIAAPEGAQPGRQLAGRDAFLQMTALPTEDVRIPELEQPGGGQVWYRVRGLTGKERDRYETSITVGKGRDQTINMRNARAKLVVHCVVDEAGKRVFSDEDVAWLGDRSAQALERLFDVARRLSGLTQTDVEELTEGFD